MSEQDKPPRRPPAWPVRPMGGPLDYESRVPDSRMRNDQTRGNDPAFQPRTPYWVQMLAGFGAWVVVTAIMVAITWPELKDARHFFDPPALPLSYGDITAVIISLLVGLGVLSYWLQRRCNWRGFLPGVAVGLVMTWLIPVIIIGVWVTRNAL